MKILSFLVLVALFLFSCSQTQQTTDNTTTPKATPVVLNIEGDTLKKVTKSVAEWKTELTKEEFYVLREAGTERSFSGDLWDHKGKGTYVCAGCQLPLFSSDTKFKSGTGWPSYWEPIKDSHVAEKTDSKYGWNRVEVLCARCDGHLGHVFEDGPEPTGLRYCINSVSMDFVEEK